MAFVAPLPAELQARYPEFAGVSSPRIQIVLDETVLDVGENWPDEFRRPAMLALTAHLLAQEGVLRNNATSGASTEGQVTSVSVGDVSTSFADLSKMGSPASMSSYETTAYGKRFLDLKRLAFGLNAAIVRA
jgi:hypothetical protein